jgi:hypothetical protein
VRVWHSQHDGVYGTYPVKFRGNSDPVRNDRLRVTIASQHGPPSNPPSPNYDRHPLLNGRIQHPPVDQHPQHRTNSVVNHHVETSRCLARRRYTLPYLPSRKTAGLIRPLEPSSWKVSLLSYAWGVDHRRPSTVREQCTAGWFFFVGGGGVESKEWSHPTTVPASV